MKQYVRNLFYSIFTKLQLGRWNQTKFRVSIVKSYLADIDNCGIYQYKSIDITKNDSTQNTGCKIIIIK
jgi:hypothetical protein